MKEITIEIIKILKIPLILVTLYIIWPNDLKLKEITLLIDELKYSKDGDLEIKFMHDITQKIVEKAKKLENDTTYSDKAVRDILIDIQALDYYAKLNKKSSNMIGVVLTQVKIRQKNIKDIFGVASLKKDTEYTIKQPISVFEYSEYQTLLDPVKYDLSINDKVKVIGIKEFDEDVALILEIQH